MQVNHVYILETDAVISTRKSGKSMSPPRTMAKRTTAPPGQRTAPRDTEAASPGTTPLLPHEHDENAESGAAATGVIRQAARDLAAGQVDTDNYTRVRGSAAAAARRGRRKP